MAISEFELIKKYFTSNDRGEGISLGIGDDCALISIPSEYELAITTDTQNEGNHPAGLPHQDEQDGVYLLSLLRSHTI